MGYENLFQNCRFTGRNPVTPAFPKFSLRNSSGPKSYKHWGYEAAWRYGNPAKNYQFSGGIPVIHAKAENFSQEALQLQIAQALRLRNCLGLRSDLGKQPIPRGRNPVTPSNSSIDAMDSAISKSHNPPDCEIAWGNENSGQNCRCLGRNPAHPKFPGIFCQEFLRIQTLQVLGLRGCQGIRSDRWKLSISGAIL